MSLPTHISAPSSGTPHWLPTLGAVVRWDVLPPLDWNDPQTQEWLRVHAPAIIFGLLLMGAGTWMLAYQARHSPKFAMIENPREAAWLRNRGRRRTQVAGMFLMMGLMIPIGDCLIPWKQAPRTFALYWLIVILLAAWTGLLAIGDLFATRAFMNSELRQLRSRMELEKLAAELQHERGRRERE